MPRIDPLQLLNCLNVLLTPTGGIKSEQEVSRISSLMEKFSKKLVSKCVYLLILKASDVHLLSMFMASGGWSLIYNWLVHAIEAKNYPFLIELLEVIIMCPADIERLKSNPMPRQIKYLSKDNSIDPKVKDLASEIIKHWIAIVKGAPTSSQNASADEQDNTSVDGSVTNTTTEVIEMHPPSETDGDTADGRGSSEDSQEEYGERDDSNYIKSTSPSSDSLNDSDDHDDFVPYKKSAPGSLAKKKTKNAKITGKKEKSRKSLTDVDKAPSKLKSKLVNDVSSKDPKKASIKLKIEKKREDEPGKRDRSDSFSEKTIEEKLKEKRRQREEKEREKFARLKREREKKESKSSKDKRAVEKSDKSKEKQEDKAKGELAKLIPKSLDKLGRIPKLSKDGADSKDDAKRKEEAAKIDKQITKPDDKKVPKKDDATRLAIQRLKEERDKEAAKKEAKKATLPVPPKKPVSMSVEKRFAAGEAKPKTVKAYNSKFRLTGLEQETPKPPSRKPAAGSAAPANATAPVSNAEKNAVKRSPTKDIENEPAEKKMKSPEISLEEKSPVSSKTKKRSPSDDDMLGLVNDGCEMGRMPALCTGYLIGLCSLKQKLSICRNYSTLLDASKWKIPWPLIVFP